MAKKSKGNRVQVILECTEQKESGILFVLTFNSNVMSLSRTCHIASLLLWR